MSQNIARWTTSPQPQKDESVFAIWNNPGERDIPAVQQQSSMLYRLKQAPQQVQVALDRK